MPTNYTGNPTATQSPASQPGPGVFPTLAMPNDGEPLNVASLRQNEEALADYIAWLASPKARSGLYSEPAFFFQNARGQRKFLVDHLGYPGGDLKVLVEQWRGNESQVGTGPGAFTSTNLLWTQGVQSTVGGQLAVTAPDSSGTFYTRNLIITLGTGAGDFSYVIGNMHVALFGPTRAIAMEWDVRTDLAIDQMHLAQGLGTIGYGAMKGPNAGFAGMSIYKGDSDTNWKMVAGDGLSLSTVVDSGVAVATGTHYKMRLEYLGSGVADNSVSTVRGYINGTELPSPITANVPGAGVTLDSAAPFFIMTRDTGSAVRAVSIGQVRIAHNTN